jgi:hypothetical protein
MRNISQICGAFAAAASGKIEFNTAASSVPAPKMDGLGQSF